MAKKKSTPDMLATNSKPSARGDRHKPRKSLMLPVLLHQRLMELAKGNKRPIQWEAALALTVHLKKEGVWSDEDDAALWAILQ